MSRGVFLLVLAAMMAVLIPYVPKILRLRIASYRRLGRHDKADYQERHFAILVPVIRIVIASIVLVILAIAIRS